MQYLSVFITKKKKKKIQLQVIISVLGTHCKMELELNLAKSCLCSVGNVFRLGCINLPL